VGGYVAPVAQKRIVMAYESVAEMKLLAGNGITAGAAFKPAAAS